MDVSVIITFICEYCRENNFCLAGSLDESGVVIGTENGWHPSHKVVRQVRQATEVAGDTATQASLYHHGGRMFMHQFPEVIRQIREASGADVRNIEEVLGGFEVLG